MTTETSPRSSTKQPATRPAKVKGTKASLVTQVQSLTAENSRLREQIGKDQAEIFRLRSENVTLTHDLASHKSTVEQYKERHEDLSRTVQSLALGHSAEVEGLTSALKIVANANAGANRGQAPDFEEFGGSLGSVVERLRQMARA